MIRKNASFYNWLVSTRVWSSARTNRMTSAKLDYPNAFERWVSIVSLPIENIWTLSPHEHVSHYAHWREAWWLMNPHPSLYPSAGIICMSTPIMLKVNPRKIHRHQLPRLPFVCRSMIISSPNTHENTSIHSCSQPGKRFSFRVDTDA